VSTSEQLVGSQKAVTSAAGILRAANARPNNLTFLPDRAAPANVNTRSTSIEPLLKRVVDVALSCVALLIALPVLALIALLIRLDSPGPVLFRQTRLGLNGRAFDVIKFRTMNVLENGDTIVQASENDARITRVGAWLRVLSLDELPQLLNVLAGEMSLVGPRPHARAHDAYYAARIPEYEMRQSVKPGITGWAQIHGLRGETKTVDDMRRRVAFDVWYAKNATLATDFFVLLCTPLEVFRSRNAR
jgi:putative colanic acid biosynthesis UDP-glucose lipid carrier transferase